MNNTITLQLAINSPAQDDQNTMLDVLYEDNHLLILNKPNLIATMGSERGVPTFLDQARSYIKEKYAKPGNVYLGVVSRLDAYVSGVIVFARTSKAASRLTRQFGERSVRKTYWAITESTLPKIHGELLDEIAKDERQKRMIVVENSTRRGRNDRPEAKEARLKYAELGRSGQHFLYEIELLTGRKHQIRVQLSNAGAAILGDRKYDAAIPSKNGICLHSRAIELEHPTTKKPIKIQCDPPNWWKVEQFFDTDAL